MRGEILGAAANLEFERAPKSATASLSSRASRRRRRRIIPSPSDSVKVAQAKVASR
jgi:hypothetical protein